MKNLERGMLNQEKREERITILLQDIRMTQRRVEEVMAESEKKQFTDRDIHGTLEDVRMSMEIRDTGSAYCAIKQLVEEYGEETYELGRILGQMKEEKPKPAPEIKISQREYYTDTYRNVITEPEKETGFTFIKNLFRANNPKKTLVAPILMIGIILSSGNSSAQEKGNTGISRTATVEEVRDMLGEMNIENYLRTPQWQILDPETQIQVLRESVRNGKFDSTITPIHLGLFLRNHPIPEDPGIKTLFEEIAKKAPAFIFTLKGPIMRTHFRDETITEILLKAMERATEKEMEQIMENDFNRYIRNNQTLFEIFEKRAPGLFLVYKILERNRNLSLQGIIEDPAWSLFKNIPNNWIPTENIENPDRAKIAEHGLMIARNLHFQGIEPEEITREMIVEESERILEMREKMKEIPIFKDRNVIMIADNEKNPENAGNDETHRFGLDTTAEEVKHQQNSGEYSLERFRINTTTENPESVKNEILSRIAGTAGPLTILLEGHGIRYGFHITNRDRITPRDFADALNERHRLRQKEKGQTPEEPVIIIYNSCFGSNQGRYLYEHLNPDVQKPVIITKSEHGQSSYTNFDSIYHSHFLRGNIFRKHENGIATVGGSVEEALSESPEYQDSNPSVYVPGKNNKPMQIAMEHTLEETNRRT